MHIHKKIYMFIVDSSGSFIPLNLKFWINIKTKEMSYEENTGSQTSVKKYTEYLRLSITNPTNNQG